jgi:hypothetical protein
VARMIERRLFPQLFAEPRSLRKETYETRAIRRS